MGLLIEPNVVRNPSRFYDYLTLLNTYYDVKLCVIHKCLSNDFIFVSRSHKKII